MRNILLPILSIFLFFTSCEKDESLDPRPVLVPGQFVRLDVITPTINFSDLNNAFFVGNITTPSNNIVKYELFVRRRNANGQNTSDFVPFRVITSFPNEFKISAQDIATALNVSVSDLQKGDIYRFIGYSYDANGNKAGYLNLSRTVQSTVSMKQGYRFSVNLDDINPDNPFNNYSPFGL